MNVKDKLAGFSKIVLREAETKRVALLSEMNRDLRKAQTNALAKAGALAERTLNEERYKAEQRKNKEVLTAAIEAKRALYDLRKNLKAALMKDVMVLLADYIETDEYRQTLIRDIKALAVQYGGKLIICLCRRDMLFASGILAVAQDPDVNASISVQEDLDDLIGGYRAILPDRNIVVDHSYQEKLREADEAFNGFKII